MPSDASREHAAAWLRKAANDLRNIALVLPAADPPLDTVAFHAQQAAEKALKALLTAQAIPFPRTHDLEILAQMLPESVRAELAIDPETLGFLAQLAVTPRYPDGDDVDLSTARSAARAANEVFDRVRDCLARAAK